MRMRLPRFRRRPTEVPPREEVVDPGPAFRIIDPPDETEHVTVVEPEAPVAGPTTYRPSRTAAPPPPLDDATRWGMTAARKRCDLATPPEQPEVVEPDRLPVPRVERAVLALAARTEVLSSAMERLEVKMEEVTGRFVDVVTHGDLLEVEGRRARLAAEMSRLTVELKGELDRRISELGRALADRDARGVTVDQRGPLDLADARRQAVTPDRHVRLDLFGDLTSLDERRSA